MFSKLRRRTANNRLSGPLTHLLTSNNPPSDVEETLARNIIQAMRDSLIALGLDYLYDPSAAASLDGHKATIIKRMAAHQSIISPLRKLPPELLQVIFHKACWATTSFTFMLPWSLSHVCRLWRTIVHATPILWSCISIKFKPPLLARPPTQAQEARLKFILQRSSNVDLRVSICGCIGRVDKRLSLLRILMAHSERWEYLDLDLNVMDSIMSFQAVKGHLPRLSQLHLTIIPSARPITIDMFSIAPRLETVVIGFCIGFNSIRMIVPLHQLNTYVQKPALLQGNGALKTPLVDFSHLVKLEICLGNTIDPPEPLITFPRLKFLVIFFSYTTYNSADGFFERLILPSISEIIVRGQANGVLPMSLMVSRSLPCNLLSLSITTTILENASVLTSLLLLIPRLNDLQIPLSPHLDILTISENPVLLPSLQSLCISVPDSFLPSFHSYFTPLIATRIEMPSNAKEELCLRTLQLKFETQFSCRTAYLAMKLHPQASKLDGDVLSLLNLWKKKLVKEIPCLSDRRTPRKTFINKLMHWRRLDQLFNAIEGYDVPTSGYLHVRDVAVFLDIEKKLHC